MASKDTVNLILRLPKPLHKRLKQRARRNNVSLNTEIVNQLEGQPPEGVKRAMETLRPLFETTVTAAVHRALYEAGIDPKLPFKIRIEPTKPEQK
jgi:hypothetical protein